MGIALVLGCGEESGKPLLAESTPATASPSGAVPASTPSPRGARARPLPGFEGWTLDGQRFQVSSLLGRRALLFFFNPAVAEAQAAAAAVASVARLREEHNFQVVGIALAGGSEAASRFTQEHGLKFPIVDDASGRIANRLALRAPAALVGIDAEGNVSFALAGLRSDAPNPAAVIEANLREALRLPSGDGGAEPRLGERPRAPSFHGERIDGGTPVDLTSFRGTPLILFFFLHTCPHCHKALEFLREELAGMPENRRPALVGVSLSNRALAVREALREDDLDFFPVVLDPDHAIRTAYGVLAGVPDLFLIDADGFVVARNRGWREDRDPALLRMRLAKLAGLEVPLLLRTSGYSGNDACAICHVAEHETWLLTRHAGAFDTLVRFGADRNEECIGCHVVGYGQPGGYTGTPPSPYLENVGCEMCHARGGPHVSPAATSDGNYEAACLTCHDQKHSLGFEYKTFLPRVSHEANAQLMHLPLEEKRKVLAERARPRQDLLPATAAYVGSNACRSCHEMEYGTWSKSRHGAALSSLASKGETSNAKCLTCHTTAFGRPGGFPDDGRSADQLDLARVGCESCHGPGEDHVKDGAVRIGTIVSLGDKCNSCVILQICGACHDDANDPGFEFAVDEKIEVQRHGTIEPGTGKPKGRSAQVDFPAATMAEVLERAFASFEERS
jgi:peroxiredoxin/nitrate/TMAO reductase-like tetraheme cytochrome c subunit